MFKTKLTILQVLYIHVHSIVSKIYYMLNLSPVYCFMGVLLLCFQFNFFLNLSQNITKSFLVDN